MRSFISIFLLITCVSCFGSFSDGERYFHQGDYENAISEFNRTLFINVNDLKSLHLRARSYEELEDFDKAVEDYETIIKYDETYAQAYAGIGKLYWKQEDYINAQKFLLLAAKEDGEDYDILFLLGRAMLMNKDYHSANEFLQLAKELNPDDSRVYFYQGMARSQIGDIFGAAGSFNMCLRHDPENITAKYNRGLILLLMGNSDWALEDFEDVLKANPNHIEALARRGSAKIDIKDKTGCQDLREAAEKGSLYAQMNLERCE